MAKVTTVFTYTIPAVAGATIPPPAPINCGCDDFVLIFRDRALLQIALRGVLTVSIKGVAVSATPVSYVDPESGVSRLVWKYDYTIEYDTDDLTDATYRIRRCDILYNCCRGCALEYTDRKLEQTIQLVSGPCVDNTDPLNPVVNPVAISGNIVFGGPCEYTINQTVTSLARVGTTSTLRYVNETGANTDIDLCPIVSSCFTGVPQIVPGCGITWNPATQDLNAKVSGTFGVAPLNWPVGGENAGAEVYCSSTGLRTHPPHFGFAAQTQVELADPAALTAAGQNRGTPVASFVINNPSTSRSLTGRVSAYARAYGGLSVDTKAELMFAVGIDNGTGVMATTSRRVALNSTDGPPNLRYDFELGWDRVFAVPPAGSITLRAEAFIVANIMTGGQYGFDGPLDCYLTYAAYTA